MTALDGTEGQAMGISLPTSEATSKGQSANGIGERTQPPSLIVKFGRVLRRVYKRAGSAILNPDGDIMRL